jgi:hypothetical protein
MSDVPPEPEPDPAPDEPDLKVTTSMTKDFLGRSLVTPGTNSKDYLGRVTVAGDKDFLGRSLVA